MFERRKVIAFPSQNKKNNTKRTNCYDLNFKEQLIFKVIRLYSLQSFYILWWNQLFMLFLKTFVFILLYFSYVAFLKKIRIEWFCRRLLIFFNSLVSLTRKVILLYWRQFRQEAVLESKRIRVFLMKILMGGVHVYPPPHVRDLMGGKILMCF